MLCTNCTACFGSAVFRRALPGLGGDVGGGHGARKEQRGGQQLHPAAVLSQTQPARHRWHLGRGEATSFGCILTMLCTRITGNIIKHNLFRQ